MADAIKWRVFIHMDGKEFSQPYDDLEQILRSFCPDLWKGEIDRVEGPNGERCSIEDLERLCASRGLVAQR
jgi:hypothetical protein